MATFDRKLFHRSALAISLCLTAAFTSAGLAEQATSKNAYDKYIAGHRFNENARYLDAINILSDAIKLDPKFADAYISRGFSYSKLGNYPSAILDYMKALEIQPLSAYAHNNLGFTYLRNGNLEKAIEEFNTALTLMKDGSGTAGVYANRAEAFMRLGDYESSIADADKAISLDPTDHDPYETKGEAYLHKGNQEKALDCFRLALEQKYNEANGFHEQGETQFLRASLLDQIARQFYLQSKKNGYPVESAKMLQDLKQSIVFADNTDELTKTIERQISDNGYKGISYKIIESGRQLQIDFASPLDAKLLCRNMGWTQAYAVSGDAHQNSWRIMVAAKNESAQKDTGVKRRIAARFPVLGVWNVQCSLAERPQGELPDAVAGASPAYFLGTYKDSVSSIALRKDTK